MADRYDDHLLLWLDLETSGSDEQAGDCILEVGAVLTAPDLARRQNRRGPDGIWFTSVVRPTAEGLGSLMLNPTVRKMHEDNGLLAEILAGHGSLPHVAARNIVEWAQAFGATERKLVLCGSGVGHFDRRFIARWMPELHDFLAYWVIDIGVIRRAHRMWVGTEVSVANDAKPHRALADARLHLEEARAYRDLWRDNASMVGTYNPRTS